ncbi:TetR/AcrR family transcriptional regulator [Pyruvatibacter mobilis]|uniref:TetR/AcrR family transcriptional regulator n=1 Tax=Pyruvatibacter mobilis TaxID=1712261 RepID=UPI003BB18B4F
MTTASASRRKPKGRYHHGDLREALIEAALAEVAANGPEAVSFSALARQLKVSQAAPYRHFADRDMLLAAAATRAFADFNAHLQAAVTRGRKGSGLARMAHAYVAFGLRHTGTYRLMYASRHLADATLDSPLHQAAEDGFLYLMGLLGAGGAVRGRAERLCARAAIKLLAGLHGVVMMAEQGLLPPRVQKVTMAELVDELVRDAETAMEQTA